MKYDAIVIGSGIAGITFARACHSYGKRVALIEKNELGGTAIANGCLPIKIHKDMIVDFLQAQEVVQIYGGKINNSPPLVYDHARKKIKNLSDFTKEQIKGVDLYFGEGEFLDAHTFLIGEKKLTADIFVIATGTKPVIPLKARRAISHQELLGLQSLPQDLVIVGGGVEAVEIADIYSSYGVKVDMVFKEEKILQHLDDDLKEELVDRLKNKGVNLYKEDEVINVIESTEKIRVITRKEQQIDADYLLYTSIRALNTVEGIEDLGILHDDQRIKVDHRFKTNIDHIYSIGDSNGICCMAHVAYNQGIALADYLYRGDLIEKNYGSLPKSIFTLEEISGIGLGEKDLVGEDYQVIKIELKDLYRAYSKGIKGFAKLIYRGHELLGYWIVSRESSSLMGDSGLWFDRGCNLKTIAKTLFINPSVLEILPELYLKSIKGDE